MVTIKMIAKECGFSIATVSKALNGAPDISAETKETIRKVASQMGYTPNSAARMLKTSRSYNFGVLFEDQANKGLTHSFFSHILNSFKHRAEELGYDISFISDHMGGQEISYVDHARYRNCDGVVIASVDYTEHAVVDLANSGIPVVNFDVDVDCQGIYKVTGDNYDMGYQSAKYITEKVGPAANIVVMDVPSSGSVCELRKQGFYDYLKEVSYDESNIFEVQLESFARDKGLAGMADVLEAHPQIDAVFSMDDETSMGAIQAITEAGRKDIKAITGGGGCQEYFRMINDPAYADLGLASALYSPAMSQDAIRTAIDVLEGGHPESVVVIPTTIVSADNVADYLDPENTVY